MFLGQEAVSYVKAVDPRAAAFCGNAGIVTPGSGSPLKHFSGALMLRHNLMIALCCSAASLVGAPVYAANARLQERLDALARQRSENRYEVEQCANQIPGY